MTTRSDRRRSQLHILSGPAGAQTELFPSAQASPTGLETPKPPSHPTRSHPTPLDSNLNTLTSTPSPFPFHQVVWSSRLRRSGRGHRIPTNASLDLLDHFRSTCITVETFQHCMHETNPVYQQPPPTVKTRRTAVWPERGKHARGQ